MNDPETVLALADLVILIILCLVQWKTNQDLLLKNTVLSNRIENLRQDIEILIKPRLRNVERKHMDLDEDVSLLFKHLQLEINERETLKEIEPKKRKNRLFNFFK